MIIEIKDLPKNRNIKKVTFDIEFEDGEPVSDTETTVKESRSEAREEKREKKDVPPEMSNMEF